jgi:hypothetical protein
VNGTKSILDSLKRILRQRLSSTQRLILKKHGVDILAVFCRGNLRRLAQISGSDKWGDHWYCQYYEKHFAPLRRKPLILLEIGIGGYADPQSGGASLRMWRRYFPRGRIYGVDIADKTPHNERRINTLQGDQGDEEFLRRVIAKIGKPDIIIDDGSHINCHVVKTFQTLFPLLADQGIYVVEDTQTAYWPEYGGSSKDLSDSSTSMGMLKGLIDGLNYAEFKRPDFVPSYFDRHIVSMHFYHNLVFVFKGLNDEGSNLIKNQE